MSKHYCVYIMTNKGNNVFYTGVTGNILRRIQEHKEKTNEAFTKRYNVTKLVYYEIFDSPNDAIGTEKQIKAGPRRKKIALVNSLNPEWKELYDDLLG